MVFVEEGMHGALAGSLAVMLCSGAHFLDAMWECLYERSEDVGLCSTTI